MDASKIEYYIFSSLSYLYFQLFSTLLYLDDDKYILPSYSAHCIRYLFTEAPQRSCQQITNDNLLLAARFSLSLSLSLSLCVSNRYQTTTRCWRHTAVCTAVACWCGVGMSSVGVCVGVCAYRWLQQES